MRRYQAAKAIFQMRTKEVQPVYTKQANLPSSYNLHSRFSAQSHHSWFALLNRNANAKIKVDCSELEKCEQELTSESYKGILRNSAFMVGMQFWLSQAQEKGFYKVHHISVGRATKPEQRC